MTREQFIKIVESFVGTPVQHQGRSRSGVDCGGLLVVSAKEAGFACRDLVGPYSRTPSAKFEAFLGKQLERIGLEEVLPGDWLLFWMDEPGVGQHVACVVERSEAHMTVVHTHHHLKRVVRQVLPASYKERIVAALRIRELEVTPWQR